MLLADPTPLETADARDVCVRRLGPHPLSNASDCVAVEMPVVIALNGEPYVTLMATPGYCQDLAIGFLLSEGVVEQAAEIGAVEADDIPAGKLIAAQIPSARHAAAMKRRRCLEGRTGCGICGVETPDLLHLAPKRGRRFAVPLHAVQRGLATLEGMQPLRHSTGMTHAAAFCRPDGACLAIREDVGRHNALDKLIGWLAVTYQPPAAGFVAITSRASYEMVQKAANVGLCFIAAISAPTSLAVDCARQSDVTLVARVKRDGSAIVYAESTRQKIFER